MHAQAMNFLRSVLLMPPIGLISADELVIISFQSSRSQDHAAIPVITRVVAAYGLISISTTKNEQVPTSFSFPLDAVRNPEEHKLEPR